MIKNLVLALLIFALPRPASACPSFMVPVAVPGVQDAQIYGELCLPSGSVPSTVMVLVHTTGANHNYWDPPSNNYSFVRAANSAGYATFNLDRLGSGLSTKPANASLVTVASLTDAVDQVVELLKAGGIGGIAFPKAIWVGSSYGAAYGWAEATRHPGRINGFVFTSIMHLTKDSFMLNEVLPNIAQPVGCDPNNPGDPGDPIFKRRNVACGYISTRLGAMEHVYFYGPGAVPGYVPQGQWDAMIRDVVPLPLLLESLAVFGGIVGFPPHFEPMPVETDYARNVTVPSLIVVGDRDQIFCKRPGDPDGLQCDAGSILAYEAPYYGVTPDVYVPSGAGHAFTLHQSAPAAFQAILAWADARVGSH